MAVSPNTVLGKYHILREIARSNDIVYEAIDPKMNRRVAVKELQLPLHLAGTQKRERVERFYREAKAAGTLTHPNIVTIHEIGQENERHFLVMEYLDGQSLRDILQLQGALPIKETLEIALQLCEALSYAHAHGIVHRDVKPDNIHILPGGIIKLTDFGIARITADPSITSQGQVFGTPSYMSPEQVASQAVDHRTDLFSTGITLYEMLTGRKPFVGDSVITITYNIMNSQPPVAVGVPPALQAILQKGMAKDANLRYQNAAAMAADLRAAKFSLATQHPGDHRRAGSGHGPGGADRAGTLSTVPPSLRPPGLAAGGYYSPMPGAPQLPTSLGLPAINPYATAGAMSPAPDNYGAPAPFQEARTRRRGGSGAVSLGLAGLGLITLVGVMVWGIVTALNAVSARQRQSQAAQYAQQAARALRSGDYQAAARGYQAAQQAAPPGTREAQSASAGLSTLDTTQAQQQAARGDTAGALSSYQQAVALNARNAVAYDDLGTLRWQQRDENGALDAWGKAIQADASSPAAADARSRSTQIYLDRAQKAFAAHDYPAARSDAQQVISINPGSPEATQAQAVINNSPFMTGGG